MGTKTGIEWTDHTFNLVIGCTQISPGCRNCYAKRLANQHRWSTWGDEGERKILSDEYWEQPFAWDRKAERDGKKHLVFCSSLADYLEDHPIVDSQRQRLFRLIEQTSNLIWLLLTKRTENLEQFLPNRWLYHPLFFPQNVWLGISVESQFWFETRMDEMIDFMESTGIYPPVFLSCEPLLSPVHLERYLEAYSHLRLIDWVIIGGESGPHARLCSTDWIREIVSVCRQWAIPVFVKQLGSNNPDGVCHEDKKLSHLDHFPEDLRIREFPEEWRRDVSTFD